MEREKTEFDCLVEAHQTELYDEDGDFDWDFYQYLCDIAAYWGMDE